MGLDDVSFRCKIFRIAEPLYFLEGLILMHNEVSAGNPAA